MNARINPQPIAAPSILGLYAFAGSTLIVAALTQLLGSSAGNGWELAAGYMFIVSAICAWYTASALAVFEGVSGRAVLPVGTTLRAHKAPSVAPGERGVAKGQ